MAMFDHIGDAIDQILQTAGAHLRPIAFLTTVCAFFLGPYDVGIHAFTLTFVISALAILLDYLKAWIDPRVDDRLEINRMASIFMWRWISYVLIMMSGHMTLNLFGNHIVYTGIQIFVCITEFFIVLPFIESISGIKLGLLKTIVASASPMLKEIVERAQEAGKEQTKENK